MKINQVKKAAQESFEDAPEWFKNDFLPIFNSLVESYELLAKNNITFADNLNAIEKEITVKNGVDTEISIQGLKGLPIHVLATSLDDFNDSITEFNWKVKGGTSILVRIGLKVKQSGQIRLLIIGK